MKKVLINGFVIFSLLVASALISCNGNNNKTETDSKEVAKDSNKLKFDNKPLEDDSKFVVAAADGGMIEVNLGKLALTNGSAAYIKEFGKMMVEDHGKANAELKTLAASKNISIPDSLGEKNRDTYNEMAKKKGKDFDKAYANFMVDDHKDDINAFKKEAEKGNDADIKGWAAGKVVTLEHHLEMAEAAKNGGKMKMTGDSIKMKDHTMHIIKDSAKTKK